MNTERRYSLFDSQNFRTVPRSTSTIQEFTKGHLYIGDDVMRRVWAALDTPPEQLVQMASDALLLAEHLRERQSAVQAEKEAETDAQQLEKEAQALFESVKCGSWENASGWTQTEHRAMARKAREIHGVSK